MTFKTKIVNDETSSEVVILREDDAIGFSIPISGVVSSISSVTLKFYKLGTTTDQATTYWTTASCTVSGFTVNTGLTQNLKAGEWVASINGTVDGMVQNIKTIPITVKRRSEP